MNENMNNEIFICECYNVEHQVVFRYLNDEAIVYMSTHLVKMPFWERLWHGLRYIFGYRSRYGDFDEFIFNPNDAERLEKIAEFLKKSHDTETAN